LNYFLKSRGINFYTFKDSVIFSPNEIFKDDKTPSIELIGFKESNKIVKKSLKN